MGEDGVMHHPEKTVIGQVERVKLPEFGNEFLHARIDTGAKTSSIWATDVVETDSGLEVRLADSSHEVYQHKCVFKQYDTVVVATSIGHSQRRYRIKMPVLIKKRRIMTHFTLADRRTQVYPMLIGRNTLLKKFIVDVSKGSRLKDQERKRSEQLQQATFEERI